jgi:DNA-binding Lrp family transcriptional regulator
MAFRGLDYDSFTDRRVSPLAIGRKLALDEKTVRVRVNRMEEEGFIKYYQAMPSLALFGFNLVDSYRFESINIVTKHSVIEELKRMPYILEAIDYLGQFISVSVAGESSEQIEKVAAKLAGRFELSTMILGKRLLKEPRIAPDKLDWKIIQKLRYDALCSIKDLSESLSLTPRMTEYRITKLLNSGALLIRAIVNTQRQQGLIFYELELTIEEAKQYEVVKKLSEIKGEKLWSVRSGSKGGVLLANFFGFTLAEPEEASVKALALEGVKACSLFIFKEAIEGQRPNWVDNLIEQKISSFR